MSTTVVGRQPSMSPTQPTPVPKPAAMEPKEHGAYAILGIPIASSLLIAGASVPGVCIAIAAVAGFLAHEPLLIVCGLRGLRAKRTTPAATKRLLLLLLVTLAGGTTALILGSPAVRWSLLACALLATTSFAMAIAGRHRTLGGQLWGIVGLSVTCLPILLAGGLAVSVSLEIWTAWMIGFAATTLAVRSVIAAQKRKSRSIHWAGISALSLVLAALTVSPYSLAIVTLPMLVMSWYLLFAPPSAKHLKRVGWSLVVCTVTTAVWMIAVS
jgi:hypothetical protein